MGIITHCFTGHCSNCFGICDIIQPIILTVPATGYLEFDIDIAWAIQNLTKYEMRFSESKAGIIKGDYFPLFGFGYIDKGRLSHDKFVVYNPDASGRNIALSYGEQNLSHSKVDSIVTSDKVPVTESSPVSIPQFRSFSSGIIMGDVVLDIGDIGPGECIVDHAWYDETQGATPTIFIQDDIENVPYTTPFTAVASNWQNLFQANDHPFAVGGLSLTDFEIANANALDRWVVSGRLWH